MLSLRNAYQVGERRSCTHTPAQEQRAAEEILEFMPLSKGYCLVRFMEEGKKTKYQGARRSPNTLISRQH